MKKFITAILAILYLSTSMGATVHLHYCMGKLVNWSLLHGSSSKCSKCGMEKNHTTSNKGCCKDEHKVIKDSKDQRLTKASIYLIQAPSVLHVTLSHEFHAINISSVTENNPVSHAPPQGGPAIYIRNCVFLI